MFEVLQCEQCMQGRTELPESVWADPLASTASVYSSYSYLVYPVGSFIGG